MKIHPFAVYQSNDTNHKKLPITTDELYRVTDNKAFPLARELMHKYDLQVLAIRGDTVEASRIYLSREDGFPVCKLFWAKEKEAFAIQNIMVAKERGRNFEDKLTYFAKRVPHLMKTIKEQRLMPESTQDAFRQLFISDIRECVLGLSRTFGDIRKSVMLDGQVTHDLLKIVLNNRSAASLSKESMVLVQDALDKYDDIDSMRAKRVEELTEVFNAPMRVAYSDLLGSFMVGKVDLKPVFYSDQDGHSLRELEIAIAEPFMRVNDVTEVPDMIPTMAMLKSQIEQRFPSCMFIGESGFYPDRYAGVVPELRVMGFHKKDKWGNTALLKPSLLFMPS